MKGPLGALRFPHNAFRREVEEIETVGHNLAADNRAGLRALSERFEAFLDALKDHEHVEEAVLFPAIDERAPRVVRAYVLDHRSLDGVVEAIGGDLGALATDAGPVGRDSAVKGLQRNLVALNAIMPLHLKKEEEHLLAVVDELFSPPEQGALIGRMAGSLPPERMLHAATYMFARLTPDDREALLRAWKAGMPAPVFQGIVRKLASATSGVEWAEMATRIPDLAAPAEVASAGRN